MRTRFWLVICSVVFAVAGLCQTHSIPSWDVAVSADSDLLFNNGSESKTVWSKTIYLPDAVWVRLKFRVAILGDHPLIIGSSTLRITSLEDGAVQLLDAKSMREWGNTSAYFNGPAVLLELLAAPNGQPNRIIIDQATAGAPWDDEVGIASICGSFDDRVLSSDSRACRLVPVGCTGYMINDINHCMLSAGHCASPGTMTVAEFNVPLSTGNGSIVHPPPSDQYTVDASSIQFTDGGVGNDYCYYGCYANSTTGLTPYQAQGAFFNLASTPPAVAGQTLRVTGYGTTTSPVTPTWNQVQKTGVGPYVIFSGSTLGYEVDTTGGNSGSPVIDEDTSEAIGIHTHSGCSTFSGNNWGTGVNNAGLQTALANPTGVCAAGLAFGFPNGLPFVFDQNSTTTVRVIISGQNGLTPLADSGKMYYDTGSGFSSAKMNVVSANVYDAVFPAVPCKTKNRYYFSAQSTVGDTRYSPTGAPTTTYTGYGASLPITVLADNFQTDMGWTVQNDSGLTSGAWERGAPTGGGARGDPPTDYDGSGPCYLTQNGAGDTDVDGGTTYLISPPFSLAGSDGMISYSRWYSNSTGNNPFEDTFIVSISNDDGANWTTVETVGPTGSQVSGGWFTHDFVVSDFVAPTSLMRLRFDAGDLLNGSVVEAGVDAVDVVSFVCPEPTSLSGNIDLQNLAVSPVGKAVTIEFRDPGTTTVVASYPVALDDSGNYSIASALTGTYDIAAKGSTWLRQVRGSQTVSGPTVADFSLVNGDTDDSNQIDLTDLNAVLTNFTLSGDGDVDCDGQVSLPDLNVVFTNFAQVGDN